MYTIGLGELQGQTDYRLEGWEGGVHFIQQPGSIPFYRYVNTITNAHFFTTNSAEVSNLPQYKLEGNNGFVYSTSVTVRSMVTVPLYRYYNRTTDDHFYTINFNELGTGGSGYIYEGIACYVLPLRYTRN